MNGSARTEPTTDTTTPMRCMWVIVTPEMAKRWLDGNTGNRNVRSGVVAKHARVMRDGRWLPNGSAVQIATSGRLLDGQHRLAAVVQSGCSVGMFVATGMPEESFTVIDRGLGRTHADALRWQGEDNAVQLSATLTKAVAYAAGLGSRDRRWTTYTPAIVDTDRADYLLAHPEIRYSVQRWGQKATAKSTGGCPASILALAHHLIEKRVGRDVADLFMHQLTTQDREPADGTIRSAVRAIAEGQPCRANDDRRLALVLMAWNRWAAGREVTFLRLRKNFREVLPEIATQVTR